MDFQILGSFEVLDDGAVVRIPAGRERALLALLLVNRGRVVSADAIVHALWGERAEAGRVAERTPWNDEGPLSGPLAIMPEALRGG